MAEVSIIKPNDRVELIKGEIIKMSPIKSFHAGVINFLVEQLNFKLFGKVVDAGQNPIRIGLHSELEPDVVVAKFRKDRYQNRHPARKTFTCLSKWQILPGMSIGRLNCRFTPKPVFPNIGL